MIPLSWPGGRDPGAAGPDVSAPDVSVIVVNWNRRALLEQCLASLAQQRGILPEIVVVDNGSSDGSVDAVEQFRRSYPGPVQLISNSRNLGFCAANNQGFAAARGEFFALLNNDAEAAPEWLVELRRALRERPEAGMAASKILVWEDPRIIDKVGHLIYPDGQNRGRGTGEIDRGQYDREEEILWPDGCAAMYRRSMIREIGGFDEDLFAYGDDSELGLRGRIAGWRCVYVPTAVVRHHRGSTMGVTAPARIRLIERNRVLLAAKLFPWSLLTLNIPYFLARLGAGFIAALRGRGEIGRFPTRKDQARAAWAVVEGGWNALLMLPRTLRKRRQVDAFRKLSPSQVRRLILDHRISAQAISEQAAAPDSLQ